MVTHRHKVFLSYHHDEDQDYAEELMDFYGSQKAIIDKTMYDDYSHLKNETILKKIREDHLSDSTVTVVWVHSPKLGIFRHYFDTFYARPVLGQ